jgi:hypothetical protein
MPLDPAGGCPVRGRTCETCPAPLRPACRKHRRFCDECAAARKRRQRSEAAKRHYQRQRERILARSLAYYAVHREERIMYARAYRLRRKAGAR